MSLSHQPLSEQLRPVHLDEVVGQSHLLAQGRPLRMAFESKKIHSMILWGPPGVGKTTIARLTATVFDCEWIALSAVFSGVKDIRAAIDKAQKNLDNNQKTLLFIDEIHRFNKSQQDALLPFTESGLVTLIGATTENPSFEVNAALLSRLQVYVLKLLSNDELSMLLHRVKSKSSSLNSMDFTVEAESLIIQYADGDARKLINFIEQVGSFFAQKTSLLGEEAHKITSEMLEKILSTPIKRFDKQGDQFYDQISALHKSVRGSDPDAALYWLCRMLDGGVDPSYLIRRIIRMAWEDIGLADPRAMQIANDAAQAYERLGSPEGELALAQAVIYLAVSAKSNAGYNAYNQARAFIKQSPAYAVPVHLRNAPTDLMKKLGYGKTYRYPHNEPQGYAAGENYFPEELHLNKHISWYQPVLRGLELKISDKLAKLSALDVAYKKSKK